MPMEPVHSYTDLLYEMQNYRSETGQRYPQIASLIPKEDQICTVDLNSRTIKAPKMLSVQYDHNAEVIYFKVPRYLDNMDLTNTVCIIEYLNAPHLEGKKMVRDSGLFWVPYFDIDHYDVEVNKKGEEIVTPIIYIPWAIGGLATAYPGQVSYSIRFYLLDEKKDFLYNMSTRPAQSEVLYGMDLSDEQVLQQFRLDSDIVQQIYNDITKAQVSATTYWVDI